MHTFCTTNHAKKKCHWKYSTRKSLKDCLLVLVQKFKPQVRLPAQLVVWFGPTTSYIEFQQQILSRRGRASGLVECVEKEANVRQENCDEIHYNVLQKM